MEHEELRFVVANGPDLEMELLEEAYIGNQQIADVRRVEGIWKVTFFPNSKVFESPACETSWETLVKIQTAFSKFIAEMDAR